MARMYAKWVPASFSPWVKVYDAQACPTCLAPKGEPCFSSRKKVASAPHIARTRAAEAVGVTVRPDGETTV